MTERPQAPKEGDTVNVKVYVEEEDKERYFMAQAQAVFEYNDLSFTAYMRLSDNTPITLRYQHTTGEFYVINHGDVRTYEVQTD